MAESSSARVAIGIDIDRTERSGRNQQVHLVRGHVMNVDARTSECIALIDGQVWITQSGQAGDIVLHQGDTYAVKQGGSVVIQALTDSHLYIWPGNNR